MATTLAVQNRVLRQNDANKLSDLARELNAFPNSPQLDALLTMRLKRAGVSEGVWLIEEAERMGDLIAGPELVRTCIVNDLIPKAWPGTIYGPGGIGKSAFLNELMVCLAMGVPFYGFTVPQTRRVGVLSFEMDKVELYKRFHAIHKHCYSYVPFDEFKEALNQNVFYHCIDTMKGRGQFDIFQEADNLKEFINKKGLEFLILDTLSRIHTKDENDNNQMGQLTGVVNRISFDTGAALALAHHVPKAARTAARATARGAGAIGDGLQWSIALEYHPKDPYGDTHVIRMRAGKTNFMPHVDDVWLLRGAGACLNKIYPDQADDIASGRGGSFDMKLAAFMIALQDYWDNTGDAWPSPSCIRKRAEGVNDKNQKEIVQRLHDAGRLICASKHTVYGKGKDSEYVLLPPTDENRALCGL